MKKFGTKIGAIAMSAAMALSFAPGSVITSLAAKDEHEDLIATLQQAVPVYGLYNPNSGEHVFTVLEDERDNLVSNGWENEGVKWYAPTIGEDVFRLYNPNVTDAAGNPIGDHHYTISTSERDELLAAGWQEGDAVFKSVVADGPYNANVYCVYNPNAYALGMSGAHHLTIDGDEVKDLLALGWQEGAPKFDGYYLDIDEIGSGEDVPGGFIINKQDAVALPEDVATAFTEAAGTTGLVPVAYVAEQIVSGTNYMILCRDEKEFRMIVIYRDTEDDAEFAKDTPFVLSDYVFESGGAQDEVLSGGWHTPAQLTKLPLPEDAEAAFEKALDGFVGSTVEPMALLGTQVVSGTNYAILCAVTPVTSNSIPSVEVVTVYEDLEGNAQFANFRTVNPSDFS